MAFQSSRMTSSSAKTGTGDAETRMDSGSAPDVIKAESATSGEEIKTWRERIVHDYYRDPGNPGFVHTGASACLAARDAEITDLRAALARRATAGATAPSPIYQVRDKHIGAWCDVRAQDYELVPSDKRRILYASNAAHNFNAEGICRHCCAYRHKAHLPCVAGTTAPARAAIEDAIWKAFGYGKHDYKGCVRETISDLFAGTTAATVLDDEHVSDLWRLAAGDWRKFARDIERRTLNAAERATAGNAAPSELPKHFGLFNVNGPDGHRIKGYTAEQMQEFRASNTATAAPGDLPPLPEKIGTLYPGNYWTGKDDTNIFSMAIAEVVTMGQCKEYGRACIASNAGAAPAEPKKELAHGHRDDFYLMANGRRIAQHPISMIRTMPNWALASELFATGSNSARQICQDAGIDPDACTIGRAPSNPPVGAKENTNG